MLSPWRIFILVQDLTENPVDVIRMATRVVDRNLTLTVRAVDVIPAVYPGMVDVVLVVELEDTATLRAPGHNVIGLARLTMF